MRATTQSKKAKPESEKTLKTPETNSTQPGNALGELKIHENVISSLVRKTVLAQSGVSRLSGSSFVDGIAEFVGSRRIQDRSIIVNFTDNNRLSLEIKVNLKFGFKVPDIAETIQRSVITEVEKFTGMTVVSVNVTVQDIEEPEVETEDDETEPEA